jgi:hypothetical protein
MNILDFLKEVAPPRAMIDRFLDEAALSWAKFDPELGYLLHDSVVRNGMDGSYTIGQYGIWEERRTINYADRPCRINTYGNSFTQCHQVSDGESWQEYLAAHFGEPIRNFGVGGYGVYQAYLRMLRQEQTSAATEYVIFNVWSDDHRRSLYPWRWLHIEQFRQRLYQTELSENEASMFHANPWKHLRFNPTSGQFEEQPNPYPTPESLYQLCDPAHLYEAFRDKFDVQARLAMQNISDYQPDILRETAEALGVPVDFSTPEAAAKTAEALLLHCALRASMHVMDQVRPFIERSGKKLLVLLSYSNSDVIRACKGQPRFDQPFVDYLNANQMLYVDTLQKHIEEYQQFACSPEDYARRYYIGHYNPAGNHFFAFAIKDALVNWLEPKPLTYLAKGPSQQDLAGHLA